ncbi:hypothetical protein GOP47_0023177 [Adiantum capillus-veneris]|uniref:Protein kinase domain-containing protein n=1 Tax=Adiantum capillus-veneris TaxID=13818 RepID=A0A9D4U705_ADICA|nr:hypothetical protein GOP47_0023177 [Adiantum capillus-veneris]
MGCGSAGPFLCILVLSVLRQTLAEDDSPCLQEFKKSVKDPTNHLSNWIFGNSSAGSVCNFIGVSCWNTGENKVLAIKLQNAGLEGAFPSGLTQCRALQNLDLSQNGFTGSIPNDLCKQVPYVTSLDLSQNSFSGSIPFTLEDCQYLQSLSLKHNKLSGELPGGISVLPKLSSIDVSSNLLTGPIPSGFANRSASDFSDNPGLCGPPVSKSCSSKRNIALIVGIIVAVAAVVACLCATGVWCFLFQGRKMEIALAKDEHKWAKRIRAPKSVIVSLFEVPVKKLKFSDLMAATNDFSKDNIIGEGWTGTVYKGVLPDGSVLAVKRLRRSSQSEKGFQAEMETLGRVRHRNLVPLLGFCCAGSEEKLLVYKHMVMGTLRECLHDAHEDAKLDWITRLKIGIGAARGLAWLHHSCNPRIIHRNISSNSILLDEEYEPRITDFGLARLMNPVDTHVSTVVNGDFGDLGYVAPEYTRTLVATVKVDVFSFGVVLLELVTGQKPNDVCTDGGFKGNLSEWVSFLASHGRVEEALDMSLKGGGYDNELNQFLRIACACVARNPKERPTMYEVFQLLKAIGEKFNITDDELAVFVDVVNEDETDELVVANGK